jgi:bacteriocin-like protein
MINTIDTLDRRRLALVAQDARQVSVFKELNTDELDSISGGASQDQHIIAFKLKID